MWMKDLIKICAAKAFFVCDFMHGGGEIMKAAIAAKVSHEAASTGVRVCAWGSDPRKIFAKIGRAGGRTALSKLYLSKKLVVPGHEPVPDPGPHPERTRKFVKALLPKPMKLLSLDADGYLIIPMDDEIANACPVSLDREQVQCLTELRQKYPRRQTVSTGEEGSGEGSGTRGSGEGSGTQGSGIPEEMAKVQPGTQA